MLERDGFPPGVPCRIDLPLPDPDPAAASYGAVFGWEFEALSVNASVPPA